MIKHKLSLAGGKSIGSDSIVEFTLSESVNETSELSIGSACAAMIEVTIREKQGLTLPQYGDKIDLYEAEDSGSFEHHGVFTVEETESVSKGVYKVTAYDNISMLDKDVSKWLEEITDWPISLYTIANRVITHCGLSLANTSIPNGSYMVRKFQASGLTGRDVCKWVAEASGKFCHALPDGRISFDWYSDCPTSISHNGSGNSVPYYMGSFDHQTFKTDKISAVQIQFSANDVGTVFPSADDASNVYKVTGNYLLTAESADELKPVAESIYNALKLVSYTPASVSIPTDFRVKVGQIVNVTDPDGAVHSLYVMQKKQRGSRDSITCTGSKSRKSVTAMSGKNFKALAGKVFELETSVEGFDAKISAVESTVNGQNEKIAEVKGTADGLSSRVENNTVTGENLESRLSKVEQTAEQVRISVQTINSDGIKTENGYEFGKNGMVVSESGSNIANTVKNTGSYVDQVDGSGSKVKNITTTDINGFVGENVNARTYLTVGSVARLEKYQRGSDRRRVGLYILGGTTSGYSISD